MVTALIVRTMINVKFYSQMLYERNDKDCRKRRWASTTSLYMLVSNQWF